MEEVDQKTPVHIPDPKLRAALEKQLGKTKGAPITQADMRKLTELDERNQGIAELTGLEGATTLTELNLSGNNITDVSPLANLTTPDGVVSLDESDHGCLAACQTDEAEVVVSQEE